MGLHPRAGRMAEHHVGALLKELLREQLEVRMGLQGGHLRARGCGVRCIMVQDQNRVVALGETGPLQRGGYTREVLEKGEWGGGVWDRKFCVPKMARAGFPNGKFR